MNADLSPLEIAKNFSEGNFEPTFQFLSEDIVWTVVEENRFAGKDAVMANCRQTAAYFNSVDTDFHTTDVIHAGDKVVVTGTAEFLRQGKRINFVSACDVYEFKNNQLVNITSYCIPEKN